MAQAKLDVLLQFRNKLGGLDQATRGLESLKGKIVGLAATYLSIRGLTAGLRELTEVAGGFESSMNRVRAISGAQGAAFLALRQRAQDLGATTQYTAAQVAQAEGFLAQAGFNEKEIYEALPGVLQLAATEQMEMAEAADIASGILRGYNKEAANLVSINDVLVKTSIATNTGLRELGEAMKYAAPVASSLGIKFEEVSAELGILANSAIKGEMGGTAIRGALVRLAKPTAEVEGVLRKLNIRVNDSTGKMRPLVDIVEDLENAGADTADMMALFGQRAGPAMQVLVQSGSKAIRQLQTELQNAGGTAERVARIQMEGLNGEILGLKSAAEAAIIAIGDGGLLGAMTRGTKNLTTWLRGVTPTIQGFVAAWVDAIANGGIGEMLELTIGAGFEAAVDGIKLLLKKVFSVDALALVADFTIGFSMAVTKAVVGVVSTFISSMVAGTAYVGSALASVLIRAIQEAIAFLVAGTTYAFEHAGKAISQAAARAGMQMQIADAQRAGSMEMALRYEQQLANLEKEQAAERSRSWDETLAAQREWIGQLKIADGIEYGTQVGADFVSWMERDNANFDTWLSNMANETRATLGLTNATNGLADAEGSYTEKLAERIRLMAVRTSQRVNPYEAFAGVSNVPTAPGVAPTPEESPPSVLSQMMEGGESALRDYASQIGGIMQLAYNSVTSVTQSIESGLTGAIEGLISRTMTWGDALRNIGSTILSGVIQSFAKMAAQWITQRLIMFALGEKLNAASTLSGVAEAEILSASWTPAAVAAGIATLGAANAGGASALAQIQASRLSVLAAASGTGILRGPGQRGKDSIPAILAPGEAVLNDRAASWLGDPLIRALNSGAGQSGASRTSVGSTNVNIAMLNGRKQVQGFLETTRGQRYLYDMATRQMRTAY